MGVGKAVLKGLALTWHKPRLVVILWVVNIAYAAVIALPLMMLVQADLGHSFLGSNVRPLELMWLGEAVLKYGHALPAIFGGLLAGGLLYLVLSLFLNGGLVGRILDREGRPTVGAFLGDAGKYFWRFTRLFLASLVFLVVTFGVILELVGALIKPAVKGAATEWTVLILRNLHLLVALLLLSIVHMTFDYARIAVVADEERRVLAALRHALKFLKKRFFRSWALYLLVVAVFLLGTVLFHVVFGLLAAPTVPSVVLGFTVLELYIAFRAWVKALFFAAQSEFYRAHPY